jgi:hypothetical protein
MENLLELRILARFGLPPGKKTYGHGTGKYKRIYHRSSGQKLMKMKEIQ